MKRFGPTLLLALPFVVVLVPEALDLKEVGTFVTTVATIAGAGMAAGRPR